MSDNRPYTLIVGEGVHDVMTVVKLLSLRGFQEIDSLKELPPFAQKMIPRQYPTDPYGRLKHVVSHPTVLSGESGYAVIAGTGGDSGFGDFLFEVLAPDRDDVHGNLRSVALIADMDHGPAKSRLEIIEEQLKKRFAEVESVAVDSFLDGSIQVDGRDIPAFAYLLPDNKSDGTLERVLLAGAEKNYQNLLQEAVRYIDAIKDAYPFKNEFYQEKATVGVIANVLRPGRPNQASIHDDNWFTAGSLTDVSLHKQLSAFLDEVLRPLLS